MTSYSAHPPLIQRLLPVPNVALRTALQLLLGVAFIALSAQVRVAIGPVPITGQTLGVLLVAASYGLSLGSLTVLSYLIIGGLGVGVFTGGASGWAYLSGATGGYLLGFLLAALLVGYVSERGWSKHYGLMAAAMLLGNLAIYIPGMLWLGQFAPQGYSLSWAFSVGILPFLVGDAIKLALAMALLPSVWRALPKE